MTFGPCLHEIYPPATRKVSLSADPGAASWSSGSLCGHGCYCKASRDTDKHNIKILPSSRLRLKYEYIIQTNVEITSDSEFVFVSRVENNILSYVVQTVYLSWQLPKCILNVMQCTPITVSEVISCNTAQAVLLKQHYPLAWTSVFVNYCWACGKTCLSWHPSLFAPGLEQSWETCLEMSTSHVSHKQRCMSLLHHYFNRGDVVKPRLKNVKTTSLWQCQGCGMTNGLALV